MLGHGIRHSIDVVLVEFKNPVTLFLPRIPNFLFVTDPIVQQYVILHVLLCLGRSTYVDKHCSPLGISFIPWCCLHALEPGMPAMCVIQVVNKY